MSTGHDADTAAAPSSQDQTQASARFGAPGPGTLIQTVHLTTEKVDIHQPSLSALERLATHSPETANQLIDGSRFVVKEGTKRFLGGAIIAGVVACMLLGCSAYVIVNAGFWAGIAFFVAVVAACSLMVAALTGKVQDISWVVRLMPGRGADKEISETEGPR